MTTATDRTTSQVRHSTSDGDPEAWDTEAVRRVRETFKRESTTLRAHLRTTLDEDRVGRLLEISASLRETESASMAPPKPNAVARALRLMETEHGRRRLSTLTWETI